jgi:dihydrolipoamide dehydrogenase
MNSSAALALANIPGKLLVIGGGYIGLELGCVYAALGSSVTVVEMTDGLLPGTDRDLVRPLQKRLKESFHAIHLNTTVESLEARDTGIAARLNPHADDNGEQIFDRVLVSVGRKPNSQNLSLENTNVKMDDQGFVAIDQQRRTNDPHIYAIGDVAGQPMLAHKASREAKVAVEAIAGQPSAFDNAAVPAVVFTDPEIAWCGLTETQAKAENIEIKIAKFPWGASGRAAAIGRPDGLTKLICDPKSQRILGVGITGAGAGELIAEAVLAVEMAAVATDLAESIHPHPTLSETLAESAEAFLGHATHLYRPKR